MLEPRPATAALGPLLSLDLAAQQQTGYARWSTTSLTGLQRARQESESRTGRASFLSLSSRACSANAAVQWGESRSRDIYKSWIALRCRPNQDQGEGKRKMRGESELRARRGRGSALLPHLGPSGPARRQRQPRATPPPHACCCGVAPATGPESVLSSMWWKSRISEYIMTCARRR